MAVLSCPTCGRSFDPDRTPFTPFCCQRCQQIDLYRWLREEHGLPIDREEESRRDPASREDQES